MILGVDIGNTTISLALVRAGKCHKLWTLSAEEKKSVQKDRLQKIFLRIRSKCPSVSKIIVCSVVPTRTRTVRSLAKKIFQITPLVVGDDIKVPIKNKYRNPRQVGQDRLVCSYAAMVFYGGPLIIVDFGTAITLDAVSAKGEYLGGVIVPGIRLTTEALFKKTALLPRVRVERPREVIGRDTKQSILSGIFYGYGALCDGMIGLMAKKLNKRPRVVATGGYARIVRQFSSRIHLIDPHLVFKGLFFLSEQFKSK